MNRTAIINALIKKYKYTSYLEIGVSKPQCNFDYITCEKKYGVDPKVSIDKYSPPSRGYQMTSDTYFLTLKEDTKFDLIFVDGLHTHEQVNADIKNSLRFLSENGTIVLHDCNPVNVKNEDPGFNGTVWRAFYEARKTYDIDACVIDTDFGCGVIRRGGSKLVNTLNDSILDFNFLNLNRVAILNLISVEDFKRKLMV